MKVRLYGFAASHPARTTGLMLKHKGIEHERVDVLPGLHPLLMRLRGFRGGTVPAVRIDGRRVQGSLQIARALEELAPEPPLYPADPERRRAVEEAERWGEAELQPLPRRLFRWGASRRQAVRVAVARDAGVPAPALLAALNVPIARLLARKVGATDERVRSDLEALPGMLDRVDALIADGVIGGAEPNAADFQILTSIRVLLAFEATAPAVEDRPVADLARRMVPRYVEGLPLGLPEEWLAPLRADPAEPGAAAG